MSSSSSSLHQPKYDFVIFGATGFTGKYTVEEMIRTVQTSNFTWAVAGRNENKLKTIVSDAYRALSRDEEYVPIIRADVSDEQSLADMCKKAKVVLNCVGPYRFLGEAVVKACIQNKAHHLDISGEPQYLEKMQLNYHQLAENSGVYVVGSCGIDSLPSELGLELLRKNFPGDLSKVEIYLNIIRGSKGYTFNYATWISLIHGFANADELKEIRRNLFPVLLPVNKQKERPKLYFFSDVVDSWCIQLPSADKSVAKRTQYYHYVKDKIKPFQVEVYARMNSRLGIYKTILAASVLQKMVKYDFGRKILEQNPEFFSFGVFSKQGPTRQQLNESSFESTLVGFGYKRNSGREHTEIKRTEPDKMIVKVTGPDPAYISTPILMIQAAIVLLEEPHLLPERGGVYTPGIAFDKTTLIDRLKKKGIECKVHSTNLFHSKL